MAEYSDGIPTYCRKADANLPIIYSAILGRARLSLGQTLRGYARAFGDDPSEGTLLLMLSNRFAALFADESLRSRLHDQLGHVPFIASKARAKRTGPLSEDENYMRLCSGLLDATWQLWRSTRPDLRPRPYALFAAF